MASWLVTAVLALWLVPWNWVPGGSLHPMSAQQLFTSAEISRAEHFAGLRRLLGWSSYGVSLLVALILGLTPLGARLVRRLTRGARWWVSVAGGVLALIVVGRLATLPFALLLRRQSLDYGLTNQGLAGWFADQGKGLAVSWVVTTILVWVIVGAARRSPRYWFAWAGAAAMVVTVVGSALYPVVVEPLFNKFTPMPDSPLRSAILRLADREGVHVDEVLVADASRRTTTLNAYVSGLGGTRRVVVYDTLLAKAPPAEVKVVVAHELAHAKNHDVLLGTGLGALGSVGGVALLALLLDSRSLRARAGVRRPGRPHGRCSADGAGRGRIVRGQPPRQLGQPRHRGPRRPRFAGCDARRQGLHRHATASGRGGGPGPDPASVEPVLVREPSDGPAAGRSPGGARNGGAMSRILFVTNDFPTRRGGIETFILALCQHLPADEVVVYTASMPGDLEYDAELPFPVYRDPASMLLPTPAVARRVIDVMRRHGCDRVVFGASAPLGLLAPRLRRAGARRMVALTHGHEVWWARVPVARQLLRRIGDSVDVMTYVSEWCRDRIAPALSVDAAARMQRFSPGVDTDRFYPGMWGSGGARATGDPGRRAGRGVHRADGQAQGPGHAGEGLAGGARGPFRRLGCCSWVTVRTVRAVERLARRLGVADSVIFTGSVPWTDVPAYTDAGDVYAMPCRTRLFGLEPEAFGIVFLEAAACGLGIVHGRSGGVSDAIRECGVAWPSRVASAPVQVAKQVQELLEQSDRHGRLPRRAAALVPTWCSRTESLLSLLDRLTTAL